MARFQIIPQEVRFYDWFEKAANNAVAVTTELCEMITKWDNLHGRLARITEMEHQGDFITHEVYDLLHTTFITPIDREDIHTLIKAIDDVVDFVEAAADNMILYKVEQPTQAALDIAEILHAQCLELQKALPLLRNSKTLQQARTHAIEINRLENEGDRIHRGALEQLLEHPDQLFNLIRWKEIYDVLEDAVDSCEDVADVLVTVVIKNA